MATIGFAETIMTTAAVELFQVVWMEVTMASLAAVVYFTATGWLNVPKAIKRIQPLPPPIGGNEAPNKEASVAQCVAKALRQGRLHDALALLRALPLTSMSPTLAKCARLVVITLARKPVASRPTAEDMTFLVGHIQASTFEAVLVEVAKNKDVSLCRELQKVADLLAIESTPKMLELYAIAFAADLSKLRQLVTDAPKPLAQPFAKAVLEACAAMREVDLAAEIFENVSEADASSLRSSVEKAATTMGKPADRPEASKKDSAVASLAGKIRACGKSGNIESAVELFESRKKGVTSTLVYNSIMEACVECGDLEKAAVYLRQAGGDGAADAVSYNTLMKGHIAKKDEATARHLLSEMSSKGISASHASFHGLLNARIMSSDHRGAWKVVQEMQDAGVKPNAVTCSILLKGKLSSASDVSRVLTLMDGMEDPMDEVLFSSVVETCTRTGQLDLLTKHMANFSRTGMALSAPTYGSLIKAYGQVRDTQRIWALWEEMTRKNVQPTAVTLGCMIEALVTNGRTAEGWQLVQDLRKDEATRHLVNTVIYSTILKGFANAKETDKVMELYKEMQEIGLEPNTITYNTILNAFAHGGAMHRVPALLEDMKKATPAVEPDIVTYSTIIKGFCNSGSLDRGMKIFHEMQAEGKFTPDEVMYNSLLDGCAKEHRADDALKLLDSMKQAGVAPSNYTLSMIVKLMGRCRRVSQAFKLVEELSKEYGLKVNIQVYTCMIQACFNNRAPQKAIALHDQILAEGLQPDEFLYSALVSGCLKAGLLDRAMDLAQSAFTSSGSKRAPGLSARCQEELKAAGGGAALIGNNGPTAKSASRKSAAQAPWRRQQ